jgi:hypothetical protein
MLARRNFLQAAAFAAVALPLAAAARVAPALRDPALAAGFVLVDPSLAESVSFADAWHDAARLDRMALLTQWPTMQSAMGAAGTLSGLTRASDVPMVMQLVALQGARVLFRSEHDARASGALQHRMSAPPAAWRATDWTQAGDAWAQTLGAQLAAGGRPVAALPAALRCSAVEASACQADYLVGWSIVYGVN